MKSLWTLAFGLMLPLLAACNGPSEVADPANPKAGAGASTKQPLPADPDTNDAGGQQPKPAEVAVVEPPTGPEDALKHFLSAMITGDEEGIRASAVDNPELFMLWLGPTLPASHAAEETAWLKTAQFQRLKVGETIDIPGHGKMTMTTEHVNANRQQLVDANGPIPFILVKGADGWKVDPSPMIASRNAAALAREKTQAAKPVIWSPEKSALAKLGPEITSAELKIRGPAGYKFVDKSDQAMPSLIWTGQPRDDKTFTSLAIIHVADQAERSRPLESMLAEVLSRIKRRRDNWVASGIEYGRIGGLDFVRTKWKGVCNTGNKEWIGKEMYGSVYVAWNGDKIVMAMLEDVAPFHKQSLPICEAAVMTLQFDRRTHRPPPLALSETGLRTECSAQSAAIQAED